MVSSFLVSVWRDLCRRDLCLLDLGGKAKKSGGGAHHKRGKKK